MGSRDSSDLVAMRRASQLLGFGDESGVHSPADVVRRMLAIQAQDFPGALWSVGLRTPGVTLADVEAALAAREIVRSWPMRGTLHLVAPEDLGWMLAITRTRMATTMATRRGHLGLADRDLDRATVVAHETLARGRVARRDDLLRAFESVGLPTSAGRGYHLLFHLAVHGVIVFGPVDGKHQTFALLDEWVPQRRALEGDEALAEFALRYFSSHGPATDRDLAWWAGITLGDARKGIAAAELEAREFDSVRHYFAPGLEPAAERARVLPGFDEYLLGYQDRSAVLAAEFSARIVPGTNGIFLPTLVVGGAVVGTWRKTERARLIEIEAAPFEDLPGATRSTLEREFNEFAAFTRKPVETHWAATGSSPDNARNSE